MGHNRCQTPPGPPRPAASGEYVGSAAPTIGNNTSQHNEVLSVTGLAFTTGAAGDESASDDVFVDDVILGTPDSTPPAAIGTAPFDISDREQFTDPYQADTVALLAAAVKGVRA